MPSPRSLPLAADLGLAPGHTLVVGKLERLVERAAEVPRVVRHQDRSLMRERLHEVDMSELGRVTAGLSGGDLDDALDEESGLRPAGATIGVDRRGVGVDRVDLAVDVRNVVLPRQERRIGVGRDERREGRHVRAQICDCAGPQSRHLALGVERELGVGDMIAAMRIGQKRFRALRGPLDGTVDLLGRPGADGFLGVDEDL